MPVKGTTYRRTRYVLGVVHQGSVYQFTGLGEFLTEEAARQYIHEHHTGARTRVFRERQAWVHGVNYGTDFSDPLPEPQQEQQPVLSAK